jgi:hypothetical protein
VRPSIRPCRTGTRSGSRVASCSSSSATGSGRSTAGAQPLWLDRGRPVARLLAQHPSGALPAYEWDFGDVNPPVQAWAALEVFAIDGARDLDFLSRVFDKLLVNFIWWVNRQDANGSNLFEEGFLGLDNIGPSTGPICRSAARSSSPTPPAGRPSTPSPWPPSPRS